MAIKPGRPEYMADPVGKKFHWVTNGEPHAIRRREILAKYGSEVRKLYGYDHRTAYIVSRPSHHTFSIFFTRAPCCA